MLTVYFVLAVSALILSIISAAGKCPLFVPVILLAILACLQVLPLK